MKDDEKSFILMAALGETKGARGAVYENEKFSS